MTTYPRTVPTQRPVHQRAPHPPACHVPACRVEVTGFHRSRGERVEVGGCRVEVYRRLDTRRVVIVVGVPGGLAGLPAAAAALVCAALVEEIAAAGRS